MNPPLPPPSHGEPKTLLVQASLWQQTLSLADLGGQTVGLFRLAAFYR